MWQDFLIDVKQSLQIKLENDMLQQYTKKTSEKNCSQIVAKMPDWRLMIAKNENKNARSRKTNRYKMSFQLWKDISQREEQAAAGSSTDLVILSVQDMVMSCSPCRTPSHVWTGPRHRTGTVPSPDSILVRRWQRCFLMRRLPLWTAETTGGELRGGTTRRSTPQRRFLLGSGAEEPRFN